MKNNSILNFEVTHGTFHATIDSFKEIPALTDDTNTIVRDAYLAVTLRLDNGELFDTRWYSKRLPYIMRCLSCQLDRSIYSLKELLAICAKTSFIVTIEVDPKYGYQVEYGS